MNSRDMFPDMSNGETWEPEGDYDLEDYMTPEEKEDLHLMQADYFSDDPAHYHTDEAPGSDIFGDEEMTDAEFLDFQCRLGLTPEFIRKNRPYEK